MWKETGQTTLGNQVRLIVNEEASDTITITRGGGPRQHDQPPHLRGRKGNGREWIERECQKYVIAGIEVKGMNYMDDEVRIADTKEEIWMMTTIQSEFAE